MFNVIKNELYGASGVILSKNGDCLYDEGINEILSDYVGIQFE